MGKYDVLTKYIKMLENDSLGKWIFDKEHEGTADDPIQMPFVNYSEVVWNLHDDIYKFCDENYDYETYDYKEILEESGFSFNNSSIEDISRLDGDTVFAILFHIVRGERFCDGYMLTALKHGEIQACLKRLESLSR